VNHNHLIDLWNCGTRCLIEMEEKGEVREVRDEEGIDEMVSDQFKSLLMYYIDNNKVIELAKDFKYLSPYINIVLITKVCDNYAILIEHHDGHFDVYFRIIRQHWI
jgi:hypothetical protein